jgi:subtilisin family serine protease
MENTGTNPPDGVGTADADMDASAAWDLTQGDPAIVIAIIDEGVQMTHEDLNAKIVAQYTAIPGDPDANPNNTWDAHGTNCAGIATAETNNAQGVAGVCPNCSLMAVQIAYSSYNGGPWITADSWIADALMWAVDNGADVLSNSWGGGSPSALIDAAIAHAVNDGRGGLGSVVLFAAGNGNATPVIYPASNNSTLAVGASSPCDERKNPGSCDGENWWGSNYGADLDIVAPGVEWWSTDMMGTAGYAPGNYFDHMNGTSSATPAAAGLAGLILSYKPCLPQSRVQQIMMHSAEDQVGIPGEDLPGWDQYMGWGRISAHQALLQANEVQCGPVPCGPHVYFDLHHDSDGDQGMYNALANLIND